MHAKCFAPVEKKSYDEIMYKIKVKNRPSSTNMNFSNLNHFFSLDYHTNNSETILSAKIQQNECHITYHREHTQILCF